MKHNSNKIDQVLNWVDLKYVSRPHILYEVYIVFLNSHFGFDNMMMDKLNIVGKLLHLVNCLYIRPYHIFSELHKRQVQHCFVLGRFLHYI
jgi:hypothetical protein